MSLRDDIFEMQEVVTLLSLKKLRLIDVEIGGESSSKLLSGCPVVEDLSLKNCIVPGDRIISNTTLKFLSLEGCTNFRISICAPNLVSMEYAISGNITTLKNLSSLYSTRVRYYYCFYSTIDDLFFRSTSDLNDFFFLFYKKLKKKKNRVFIRRVFVADFDMCSIYRLYWMKN